MNLSFKDIPTRIDCCTPAYQLILEMLKLQDVNRWFLISSMFNFTKRRLDYAITYTRNHIHTQDILKLVLSGLGHTSVSSSEFEARSVTCNLHKFYAMFHKKVDVPGNSGWFFHISELWVLAPSTEIQVLCKYASFQPITYCLLTSTWSQHYGLKPSVKAVIFCREFEVYTQTCLGVFTLSAWVVSEECSLWLLFPDSMSYQILCLQILLRPVLSLSEVCDIWATIGCLSINLAIEHQAETCSG